MYSLWTNFLNGKINLSKFKSQQVNFLKDLMNGFEVRKKIKKPKGESNYKPGDLYSILLRNPSKTVYNKFLNKSTSRYNEKIYLQAKILFNLREKIFKELLSEGIIKNDSDQLNIDNCEKSIAEVLHKN